MSFVNGAHAFDFEPLVNTINMVDMSAFPQNPDIVTHIKGLPADEAVLVFLEQVRQVSWLIINDII
jgi:hypothetical protein